jgi:hypothetical protein
MRFASGGPGIERAEVRLRGAAFEPHRHDVYAVGVTTFGVQTFAYRGSRRACLPGQLHVLHPDETHDGAAGTDEGFGYRILYIAPELIRNAVGQRPLPFVAEPVQPSGRAARRVGALLADIDEPFDDIARMELVAVVADCLTALSDSPALPIGRIDLAGVAAVREHLAAHAHEHTPASTLEAIAGPLPATSGAPSVPVLTAIAHNDGLRAYERRSAKGKPSHRPPRTPDLLTRATWRASSSGPMGSPQGGGPC